MAAIKAYQAEAFLKAPDPALSAFLFYGTDVGLIAERASGLAKKLAARDQPAGEILRIDDAELEQDPDRVVVELQTVPMFGGRKIVRTTAGRRVNAALLKPIIEIGKLEGVLIVEAGNLRPDDTLRSMFEKSPTAAAVACYADEARDLEGVIREVLGAAGLSITAEAKALLITRLGADRALTRVEVEKLALYAAHKSTIVEDDVHASVGDAVEMALDRIVLAAASGRADNAAIGLERMLAAGESPQAAIAALQRHFQRLHRVRTAMDAGRTFEDAVRPLRPPLHFKQKDVFAHQCRDWPTAALATALASINVAAQEARLNSILEVALTERLILDISALAACAREGSR
jgi:DNA polymerase III subunit delta